MLISILIYIFALEKNIIKLYFNFFFIYNLNKHKNNMTIKTLIVKKLQQYINKEKYKLEELFNKENTTEKQLLSKVKNIHTATQQLRNIKFKDEYEYTEVDNKIYFVTNGHRLFITQTKKDKKNIKLNE